MSATVANCTVRDKITAVSNKVTQGSIQLMPFYMYRLKLTNFIDVNFLKIMLLHTVTGWSSEWESCSKLMILLVNVLLKL